MKDYSECTFLYQLKLSCNSTVRPVYKTGAAYSITGHMTAI